MKKEEKQTPHISSRHSRPKILKLKFNNSQFIRGKFPLNDFLLLPTRLKIFVQTHLSLSPSVTSPASQCLKITEKVAFNIASEATSELRTVLPDKSLLIGQELVKNARFERFKMRHF